MLFAVKNNEGLSSGKEVKLGGYFQTPRKGVCDAEKCKMNNAQYVIRTLLNLFKMTDLGQ